MTDIENPREVIFYSVEDKAKEPFSEWLNGLRDAKARRHILIRIRKLEQGVYGDHEGLGGGVIELRIFLRPGYRVYFGEHGNRTVILLGGSKDRQQDDIEKARKYWKEYKEREAH